MQVPKLDEEWAIILQNAGEFQESTSEAFNYLFTYLIRFLIEDIKNNFDESLNRPKRIIPADIFSTLEKLHLSKISNKAHAKYIEKLSIIKHKKLMRLKEAGYGATSDHVQFVRKVLASPHIELDVPNNEDVEDSDDDII